MQIPMGVTSDSYQFNYAIARNGSVPVPSNALQTPPLPPLRRYPSWGVLYRSGLLKDPRYLYCPSDNSPNYQFDDPEYNPWDPDDKSGKSRDTRAGYGLRPFDASLHPVEWRMNSLPDSPPVDDKNFPSPGQEWKPFPRIFKMHNLAIMTDIFSSPHRLDGRHVKGINVGFTDGHAVWVDRKILRNLPPNVLLYGKTSSPVIVFETVPFNFSTNYNPTMQAIWEAVDKQ
jgi:prepilin-type processing-associated H-X9-DG protein